jgi:glycosyltransferase involved in cell wall biosynthesis
MITVIATVLNEGESMNRLLQSLVAQTHRPDEVVLVDGGSRDDTVAIIQRYADRLPVRVLVEPGCNISAGRNRAIAAAQGDIIAVTDAGVALAPDWLQHLTQPFDDTNVQVVGGFFEADPHTLFEAAMGATVLPLADEIDAATFLPSSRSIAFRKEVWARVGGYPEWLDYCEDLVFDLRMKQITPFVFAPNALVYFRPRGSLGAFYKQYYRYARGDGKADLWRKRHAIRYLTYLVAAPLLLLLGWLIHPLLWALYLPAAAVYLYQPYRRLPMVLRKYREGTANDHRSHPAAPSPSIRVRSFLYVIPLLAIIRMVGDVAKMLGYPVGVYWRLTQHPPNWRQS